MLASAQPPASEARIGAPSSSAQDLEFHISRKLVLRFGQYLQDECEMKEGETLAHALQTTEAYQLNGNPK